MRFRIGLPWKSANRPPPPDLLDHEVQGLRHRLVVSQQQNGFLEGQLAEANARLALLQRALDFIGQGERVEGLIPAEDGDEKIRDPE